MGAAELKINARGLSNPGPRMMVKSAIDGQDCKRVRVVVDSVESVTDLEAYFESIGVSIEIDEIGEEYHILVSLGG
jgi:TusA-related sulfurtransferase